MTTYIAKNIKASEVPRLIKRELRDMDMPVTSELTMCEISSDTEKFYFFQSDDDTVWFQGEEPMDDITYHVDATQVIQALKAIGAIDEDEGDGGEGDAT